MTLWNLTETSDRAKTLFIQSIGTGLRNEGFSSDTASCIEAALADVFSFQERWPDDLSRAAGQHPAGEVREAVAHLVRIHAEQSRCYDRPTPEMTRVIQWPNNPKTRRAQPDHYVDIFEDLPYRERHPIITKETPIGSLGSCFALRIAHELQLGGYNYVIEEDDLPPDFDVTKLRETSFRMAPARVGTLFNTPSIRQVVERAFGVWQPEERFLVLNGRYIDPFRAAPAEYHDVDGYLQDHRRHTEALGRAFRTCEVMILTLGLTEAWYFADSNEYTSLNPWKIDPCLLRKKNLTVAENLADLERLFAVYKQHQPAIKFIVSVSPVPLNKTFERRMHPVEANALSKATLRVAAQTFADHHPDDVFYFPSFESVTYCTRQAWEDDQRHVSHQAVEKVMKLFGTIFFQTPDDLRTGAWTLAPETAPSVKQRIKSRIIRYIARI